MSMARVPYLISQMIFLFTLSVFSVVASAADSISFEEFFQQEVIKKEISLGVEAAHRSQLLLVREQGEVVKTPYAVIIMHGLFNSPAQMNHIAQDVHKMGYNTFNLRLPGHYEKERKHLDQVKYQDFLNIAELAFSMAQELGDKVIFIGHSTGGLTSIYTAMNHMNETAGLILFSPPLKLQRTIVTTLSVTDAVGLSGWLVDFFKSMFGLPLGRYFSSSAGLEVKKMAYHLSQLGNSHEFEFMKDRMESIPMLWINTEDDLIVHYGYVQSVASAMPKVSYHSIENHKNISHNESAGTPKKDDSETAIEAKRQINKLWREFFLQITAN